MMSTQIPNKNYIKLGQIYQTPTEGRESDEVFKRIKKIIDSGYDINYKITIDSLVCHYKPEYLGNTALHLAVKYQYSLKTFVDLCIERGADFTIKNNNGYTPLLMAFDDGIVIDSLLIAHLDKNNTTNIHCKNGISHFHVACTTEHVKVVDFFLKAGISVNECVNDDSPKYPGYTSLHFAAHYGQLQTIKLLLSYGANMNIKDAKGLTPLHRLIEKHKELVFNQELLQIISYSTLLPDDVGLTYLHISCILDSVDLIDILLNEDIVVDFPIKFDSPIWPGRTPLHVALDCNNLPAVILLLEKGANILAKDASGTSSLDMCLNQCNLHEVKQILAIEKHQFLQIKLTDGTHLLDVLDAFENSNQLEQLILNKVMNVNIFLPFDSLICPGYSLLHLAIKFKKYVSNLLSHNADFTFLNAEGLSPLHLAFYSKNEDAIQEILNFHINISTNPVDPKNLSHLHIACMAEHLSAIKHLLQSGSNPNLPTLQDIKTNKLFLNSPDIYKAGSTPFHMAAEDFDSLEIFLNSGANPNVVNVDGITPFEIILKFYDSYVCEHEYPYLEYKEVLHRIFNSDLEVKMTNGISLVILCSYLFMTNSTTLFEKLILEFFQDEHYKKLGLSKLQAACAFGDLSIVIEEIESGADVNQCIAFDSKTWPGDTPLHILFRKESYFRYEIAELLLEHGADPTLKNASNFTPFHLIGTNDREKQQWDIVASLLLKSKFTNVNPVNNEGLSHFHMCCMTSNVLAVKEFLKSGVDINATVDYFTESYAGFTPLHCAVKYGSREVIQLLVNHDADLYLMNAYGLTPFHLMIPEPIPYIRAKFNEDRTKALFRYPSIDFQAMSVFGETVFERAFENCIHLDYDHEKKNEFLDVITTNLILNKRICINFAMFTAENPNGLKLIVNTACYLSEKIFQCLINSIPNINDTDDNGLNALHHILDPGLCTDIYLFYCSGDDREKEEEHVIKVFYFENIKALLKVCEVNHKDNKGKTPLHKALTMKQGVHKAVKILLSLGADINIRDDEGKIPYSYLIDSTSPELIKAETVAKNHIKKLRLVGLYVDQTNEINNDYFLSESDINDIEKEKSELSVKFEKDDNLSISVDYFYSEMFVLNYRRMSASQRRALCNIFDSNNLSKDFPNTHDLINLQFRKARARTRLLEPAMCALQYLANLAIPQLCLDFILDYLHNNDLMNLVRLVNEKLIFANLPENC